MKLGIIELKPVIKSVAKNVFKSVLTSEYLRKQLFTKPYVKNIGDGVYRISELFLINSYLFVGSERALLVDTGIGIKGMKEAVKNITDKPLTVVVTHSHLTSIGGAGEFDEVYIDKEDLKYAVKNSEGLYKKVFLRLIPNKTLISLSRENFVEKTGNFVPLDKSTDEFNLGGKTVKLINTPSHTRGSVCFSDPDSKIVVTGHVTLPIMFMTFFNSTNMEKYKESFEKLIDPLTDGTNCSGIGPLPLSFEKTKDLKQLVDDAVDVGNDYTQVVRLRSSPDRKRALIYLPARTIRRKRKERFKALFKKPDEVVF